MTAFVTLEILQHEGRADVSERLAADPGGAGVLDGDRQR